MSRGLKQKKKVCCAAPMWIEGPFQFSPKSEFQRLVDLGCQAADLLYAASILDEVDAVESPADGRNEGAREILCLLIEHIGKLKEWERSSQVPLVHGPLLKPRGTSGISEENGDRKALRGYPSKLPSSFTATFDTLQAARQMHIYWTILLKIYLAIVDLDARQDGSQPARRPDRILLTLLLPKSLAKFWPHDQCSESGDGDRVVSRAREYQCATGRCRIPSRP
jgi:hypothetical protein